MSFTIPTIVTERLILRAPTLADFEPLAAFYASDRSVYEDGPYTRKAAWREFCTSVAAWHFFGFGTFTIEARKTGDWVGEVGLNFPDDYPEHEIGWTLGAGFEGKGYAYEAASAARDWAYTDAKLPGLVSYIDPANDRSIRLAERLGAVRDDAAPRPEDDPCLVYRHPAPETLQ